MRALWALFCKILRRKRPPYEIRVSMTMGSVRMEEGKMVQVDEINDYPGSELEP